MLPYNKQGLIFAVVGGIGAGKSTLLERFNDSQAAEFSSFDILREPLSQWTPFLKNFYMDPLKYAMSMQVAVLLTMGYTITWFSMMGINQLRERSLECIQLFSRMHHRFGNLSDTQLYFLLASLADGGFYSSDVLFLLHLPGEIAWLRALARNRSDELVGLTEDYCISLNNFYYSFLQRSNSIVILIDASKSPEEILEEFTNAFNCAAAAFERPALPHDRSRLNYLSNRRLPEPSPTVTAALDQMLL